MNLDLSHWLMFGLGALIVALVISPSFRTRFFKGLRGFLSNVNKGARNLNDQYSGRPGQKRESRQEQQNQQPINYNQPQIKHTYEYKHKGKKCEVCNGTGHVIEKVNPLLNGAPGYSPKSIECPVCKGSGVQWD